MRLFRRIFVVMGLAALLIAAGLYVPKILGQWGLLSAHVPSIPSTWLGGKPEGKTNTGDSPESFTASPLDTSGDKWDKKLFHPLEHALQLSPKAIKRRHGKAQIQFSKGLPLHEYAFLLERTCNQNGIVLIDALENRSTGGAFASASYVLVLAGDTLKVSATLGQAALPGSARLALVLVGLDSITLNDAALVHGAEFNCNLAMDPFNTNPALQALKAGGNHLTLLLEIPMEPMAYPYVNPGKHALFIHFGDKEVAANLKAALDLMPDARGVATRYGDRAIENSLLLKRIFAFIGPRHLPLLDLTESPRSLVREIASASGGIGQRARILHDSLEVEMDFARKVAQAVKTGEAVMVMDYSHSGFQRLSRLISDREIEFESLGLALVPLSHLNPLPAAEPAAAKDSLK